MAKDLEFEFSLDKCPAVWISIDFFLGLQTKMENCARTSYFPELTSTSYFGMDCNAVYFSCFFSIFPFCSKTRIKKKNIYIYIYYVSWKRLNVGEFGSVPKWC
ncbi:hypothetical protein KIL84_022964 [Mauremys mutica]|uniref:Uncharacterized protein n=1 Tax=Mauremys mutica TaxID=74926 RepID=A0A9D4ARB5_9SAUR|nr:hypothetical protein KIL84_022964 [Mauremys mutica]